MMEYTPESSRCYSVYSVVGPAAFVHKRKHSPYKRKEMIKKSVTSLKPFLASPVHEVCKGHSKIFPFKIVEKNQKSNSFLIAQMVKVFPDCNKLNKKLIYFLS